MRNPNSHSIRPYQSPGARWPLGRRFAVLLITGAITVAAGTGCATSDTLDSAESATVAADLLGVYERINGNVEQRGASDLLTYVAYQEPIKNCMSSAGFSYTPPPFHNLHEGSDRVTLPTDVSAVVEPGAESVLTGLVTDLARAAGVPEHRNPGFERLSEDKRQLYVAKVDACEPPTKDYVDRFTPATAVGLSGKFYDLLEELRNDSEVAAAMASYPDCMKNKGHRVKSVDELQAAVRARFTNNDGAPIGPGSAGWANAVSYQQSTIAADKDCRVSAWQAAMTHLDTRLPGFVETHTSELAAVDQEWAGIEASAEEARSKLPL